MKHIIVLALLFVLVGASAQAAPILRRSVSIVQDVGTDSTITITSTFSENATIKRLWFVVPALTGTTATTTASLASEDGFTLATFGALPEGATTAFDFSTTGVLVGGNTTLRFTHSEGQTTSPTLQLIWFEEK